MCHVSALYAASQGTFDRKFLDKLGTLISAWNLEIPVSTAEVMKHLNMHLRDISCLLQDDFLEKGLLQNQR